MDRLGSDARPGRPTEAHSTEAQSTEVLAGLHSALLEASGNGHCGLPTAELLQVEADLLAVPGGEGERTPLDASLIEAALRLEVAEGALVADTLGGEAAPLPWQRGERGAVDPAVAIAWVEQRLALASKVLVITGGPGVGKTTLINAILQILAAHRLRLQLCAPTGHAVNAGILPDLRPPAGDQQSDVYFVPADTPEQAVGLILRLVAERIPARFGRHPIQQVQVLCPMARGGCGARGWRFAPGDKVMQIANDYEKEVFNGDLGTIDAIDPDNSELTVLVEGRPVVYGWGELDTLVPAYACTIHKSQGSEYSAVVVPLLTQHYPMLQRNLVYTAIIRGKRLVVLVGQRKALAIAVRNRLDRRRCTKPAEWLTAAD